MYWHVTQRIHNKKINLFARKKKKKKLQQYYSTTWCS